MPVHNYYFTYQKRKDVALYAAKQTSFIIYLKTLFHGLDYNFVLSTIQEQCSDVFVTTFFFHKYNDVVLTSSLQPSFINNKAMLLGHLLIDVDFTTSVQPHDMVDDTFPYKEAKLKDFFITLIKFYFSCYNIYFSFSFFRRILITFKRFFVGFLYFTK